MALLKSHNRCLDPGPKLQPDLVAILLRFRRFDPGYTQTSKRQGFVRNLAKSTVEDTRPSLEQPEDISRTARRKTAIGELSRPSVPTLRMLRTVHHQSDLRDQFCQSEPHVLRDAAEAAYGATCLAQIMRLGLLCLDYSIAARLKANGEEELKFLTGRQICWSDSSIALSWIKEYPRRWKSFVVSCIQGITTLTEPSQWKNVSTADNAADEVAP
ncbi:hypothetical protein T10_9173 [Trichinella papuae]|uniref:Uncharacterized protein n=1 Tax=Trichinella papuae TaxID=268474 RepID=A0A0V1N6R2_9BILA|nr:hypothetical protein T10_9173 [Trichinella papuae]